MNKILRSHFLKLGLLNIGFLLISNFSQGQQSQVYNQFFMNPYIYNPAYAGVDGHGVVFAMYKQQWAKIADGPQLMHATFHTPLKGGIGIGFTGFNYSQGPLTRTGGKSSASYLVNIDRKHFLRLGMSLGMGSNQLTLPEDAIGDPAFAGNSSSYLIGDFGVTYHFDHFNVGFSLPQLFNSPVMADNGGFVSPDFKPTDHMLFKMNYRGHINHEFAIEPHILYRYSNTGSQYEIATVVHILHVAWAGATYRQDAGMVGLLGVKIKNKFAVGAAFELGNPDFSTLTGSAFEIHLGMHMGTHHKEKGGHKKDHVDHHKSWFLTHDDELVDAAERRRVQDSIRNAQMNAAPVVVVNQPVKEEPAEELTTWVREDVVSNVTSSGDVESMQVMDRELSDGSKEYVAAKTPARDGGSAWALAPGANQYEERTKPDGSKELGVKWVRLGSDGKLESKMVWEPVLDKAGLDALLAKQSTTPVTEPETTPVTDPVVEPITEPIKTEPETTPVVTPPVTTPPVTTPPVTTPEKSDQDLADSNEHHEVASTGSMVEFPPGNYLISRSFSSYGQAETYSDRLFHQGYRDVRVGKVPGRDGWYVLIKKYSSINAARQDKEVLKAKISGVWALKVN